MRYPGGKRSLVALASLSIAVACFAATEHARADEAWSPSGLAAGPAAGRTHVAYESRTEQQRRADEQLEYEEGEELEEGEHAETGGHGGRRGGGGPSQRTVGMALGISGLIVGLAGGAVTLAGSVAEDEPTLITGAVIGLVGTALGISGLIVSLTAPGGGAAQATPTFVVAASPTGVTLLGTF